MQSLDLTLDTPPANIALDEALLEQAEHGPASFEVLRLWQSPTPIVVIGRSSRIDEEVNRDRCRQLDIPIIRRGSGGAAIVAGPGCLMYAVVLSVEKRPELAMISAAHEFVLGLLAESIRPLCPEVEHQGTSDLTLSGRKFSGNSLRCKRTHLLYHGTLLYDFDLSLIATCLGTPPRQPDYRAGRDHANFVANLPLQETQLREAIMRGFGATQPLRRWPLAGTKKLVAEKYSRHEWNERSRMSRSSP